YAPRPDGCCSVSQAGVSSTSRDAAGAGGGKAYRDPARRRATTGPGTNAADYDRAASGPGSAAGANSVTAARRNRIPAAKSLRRLPQAREVGGAPRRELPDGRSAG